MAKNILLYSHVAKVTNDIKEQVHKQISPKQLEEIKNKRDSERNY